MNTNSNFLLGIHTIDKQKPLTIHTTIDSDGFSPSTPVFLFKSADSTLKSALPYFKDVKLTTYCK